MNAQIPGTEEAWDEGALGGTEEYAQVIASSPEEEAELDDAAGLKAISIRLEKSLIEDFKMIAALHGLSYQPLMRQTLRRFADCEKKRLLTEAYNRRFSGQARETPEQPDDCKQVA